MTHFIIIGGGMAALGLTMGLAAILALIHLQLDRA
jgi:hypothetical protein